MENTLFLGRADFTHVDFSEEVYLNQAEFKKESSFKFANFESNVKMDKTMFSGYADFSHTEFFKQVSMKGMKLKGGSTFKHATINGNSFSDYLINLFFSRE